MGRSTYSRREYCIAYTFFCGAHMFLLAAKAISRLLRDTSIREAWCGKEQLFSFQLSGFEAGFIRYLGGSRTLFLWYIFSFGLLFFKVFFLFVHFLFAFMLLLFSSFRFLFFYFYFYVIFNFFDFILVLFYCFLDYLFFFQFPFLYYSIICFEKKYL